MVIHESWVANGDDTRAQTGPCPWKSRQLRHNCGPVDHASMVSRGEIVSSVRTCGLFLEQAARPQ